MRNAEAFNFDQTLTVLFFSAPHIILMEEPSIGGIGLLAVGLSAVKKFRVVLSTAFRRRFLSTLELDNEDCAYSWVLDFINKHSTHRTNKLTVNTRLWQAESGRASTSFYFLPEEGSTTSGTTIML
uniref:BCS1 N-terminal domain-containing protein n=1 Tax=Ditylenchus dipsaci TaxID=166011 RepID=A0A915DCW4_9BILA